MTKERHLEIFDLLVPTLVLDGTHAKPNGQASRTAAGSLEHILRPRITVPLFSAFRCMAVLSDFMEKSETSTFIGRDVLVVATETGLTSFLAWQTMSQPDCAPASEAPARLVSIYQHTSSVFVPGNDYRNSFRLLRVNARWV